VESAVVPQYTVDPETNPVPVIVSVKAVPPAFVNAGDMLFIVDTGLPATDKATAGEVADE
jgi:hypothetical protein